MLAPSTTIADSDYSEDIAQTAETARKPGTVVAIACISGPKVGDNETCQTANYASHWVGHAGRNAYNGTDDVGRPP